MKSISIKNPYAELIVMGKKTIEIRSWQTKHRGKLIIVSSKIPVYKDDEFLNGYALGEVDLIDIRPLKKSDSKAAWFDIEKTKGYYAWILANPVEYEKPFPVKGKLHLFDINHPLCL